MHTKGIFLDSVRLGTCLSRLPICAVCTCVGPDHTAIKFVYGSDWLFHYNSLPLRHCGAWTGWLIFEANWRLVKYPTPFHFWLENNEWDREEEDVWRAEVCWVRTLETGRSREQLLQSPSTSLGESGINWPAASGVSSWFLTWRTLNGWLVIKRHARVEPFCLTARIKCADHPCDLKWYSQDTMRARHMCWCDACI